MLSISLRPRCVAAVVAGFLVSVAYAEELALKAEPSVMKTELASLQTAGNGWFCSWDATTGYAQTVRGGPSAVQPFGEDAGVAATAFLSEYKAIFGRTREVDTFVYVETRPLLRGAVVEFQQHYRGIPVYGATVNVVVLQHGAISSASSSTWPIGDLETTPMMTKHAAARDASNEPTLVIYPEAKGILAWKKNVAIGLDGDPWRHIVDASTGVVLERVDLSDRQSSPDPDPCFREWTIEEPAAGEVAVISHFTPSYSYSVAIEVGKSSFNADMFDLQTPAVYGAGITLLPGIEYEIEVSWDVTTFDSYNSDIANGGGHYDVFFAAVNSAGFLWDIADGSPLSECACSDDFDGNSELGPGQLWTFGGYSSEGMFMCSDMGIQPFTVLEPDLSKTVYLSVGLDTGLTGESDNRNPSWGTFSVHITAKNYFFNPNPIATLNEPSLLDLDDSTIAVPIEGYEERAFPLPRLDEPGLLSAFRLHGEFCRIQEVLEPYMPTPQSDDGRFPYLRDCDGFEAVNCYLHITEYQEYLQFLGYTGATAINDRAIHVDPHVGILGDNSRYIGVGTGMGRLEFGDGGVDDGEDADVIIHEYAHACFDNAHPGALSGSAGRYSIEPRSISEGVADFIACSYFADESSAAGFDPAVFAEWDAESATGFRQVDLDLKFPADYQIYIHHNGQLISRALWDIQDGVGADNAVRYLFETVKLVNPSPTFVEFAKAMLAVPPLGMGSDAPIIQQAFLDRGIFRALRVDAIDDAGNQLSGVAVEVSATDINGAEGGPTPFELVYGFGKLILLTAPESHNGVPFLGWVFNGAIVDGGENVLATVELDQTIIPTGGFLARAVYGDLVETGDFNNDGRVDGADLGLLLAVWGQRASAYPYADLNNDGEISGGDLGVLLANWTG